VDRDRPHPLLCLLGDEGDLVPRTEGLEPAGLSRDALAAEVGLVAVGGLDDAETLVGVQPEDPTGVHGGGLRRDGSGRRRIGAREGVRRPLDGPAGGRSAGGDGAAAGMVGVVHVRSPP